VAKLTLTVPEQSQNIQGVAVIKAPLEKVFEAHTNADLFKQWFARGNDATIHKFDARSGGAWHLTERSAEGEYSFCGSYHEVAKNERIIWTFEFLGLPERGHVAIERMDLVRIDDNTTEIRTLSTYQTVADRDGMVQSGMEAGWREGLEAMDIYSSGSNGMRMKVALPVRDPTTTPCRSTVSTIALALALLRSSLSVTSRRSLLYRIGWAVLTS
jgi:uncharacterized protein YndB with AHSA1/START domain